MLSAGDILFFAVGLLSVIVEAYLDGAIEDAILFPVALNKILTFKTSDHFPVIFASRYFQLRLL